MAVLQIRFYCDNAAFDDGNRIGEIARILRKIATDIESGNMENLDNVEHRIFDINGNGVGKYTLT